MSKRVTRAQRYPAFAAKRATLGQRSNAIKHDQAIGGNQGEYITINFYNFVWDSVTDIFSLDLTVQNDLRQAMGTPDGSTITGVKVFLYSGPTCTGGACYVANADGTGNFTADSQPYFLYYQILQPQQVSSSRNWQFYLAPAVQSFDFVIEAYAAFPAENTPVLAPETMPESLYATSNLMTTDTVVGISYLQHVIVLSFVPGTSAEDRALAVGKAGGTVIGGWADSGYDGDYAVYVAAANYADFSPLMQSLDSLPQVEFDGPDIYTDSAGAEDYLRPKDGPQAQVWYVPSSNSSGSHPQWARERIDAPLAWGCDTGDTATPVAVMDIGFMSLADLSPNVQGGDVNYVPVSANSDPHGTMMASIIGAVGDNGIGVTGMMWTADLYLFSRGNLAATNATNSLLYEASADLQVLRRTARSGARVVNWSGGISSASTSAAKQVQYASIRDHWVSAIRQLDTLEHHQPLFVIAAGNDARDAFWNLAPALLDSLKDRVLVVAASDSNDSRLVYTSGPLTGLGSNYGSDVNIVAPGQNVDVLQWDGTGVGLDGTSPATALVSGIAGLLFSFNPSLTTFQVDSLVIAGANAGLRFDQDGPIVNAYQSLKLAAQRVGAPLCGNRLWYDENNNLKVSRGSSTETIYQGVALGAIIDVPHGGHKIYFDPNGESGSLNYAPSGWTYNANDASFFSLSGQYLSGYNESQNMNHDGDTTITVEGPDEGSTIPIYLTAGTQAPELVTTITPTGTVLVNSGIYGGTAVMAGQQAYVAFWYYTPGTSYNPTQLEVWSVPLGGGTPQNVDLIPAGFVEQQGESVSNFSISEDGSTVQLFYLTETGAPCCNPYAPHLKVYTTTPVFASLLTDDSVSTAVGDPFAPQRVRLPAASPIRSQKSSTSQTTRLLQRRTH